MNFFNCPQCLDFFLTITKVLYYATHNTYCPHYLELINVFQNTCTSLLINWKFFVFGGSKQDTSTTSENKLYFFKWSLKSGIHGTKFALIWNVGHGFYFLWNAGSQNLLIALNSSSSYLDKNPYQIS